jgi:flagellar biosynthesis GTPase FlhF
MSINLLSLKLPLSLCVFISGATLCRAVDAAAAAPDLVVSGYQYFGAIYECIEATGSGCSATCATTSFAPIKRLQVEYYVISFEPPQLETVQKQVDEVQKKQSEQQQQLTQLQDQIQQLQKNQSDQLEELQKQIQQAQENHPDQKEYQQLQRKLQDLQKQPDQLKQQLADLQKQPDQLKQTQQQLQTMQQQAQQQRKYLVRYTAWLPGNLPERTMPAEGIVMADTALCGTINMRLKYLCPTASRVCRTPAM